MAATKDNGTKENPWQLKTPPGTSEYIMYKDESVNPPVLGLQSGQHNTAISMACN